MGKVTNIKLPNGFSISCESDDAVDITQNAGENVMEAQDDAQKPVTQDAAEYDAAAEVDTKSEIEAVQEVAKANESTFFGLAMMKRSQEGFGIKGSFKKMNFATPQQACKSAEVKAAIAEAKKWAQKKGYSLATAKDVDSKTISVDGATIEARGKGLITLIVFFKNKKGKVIGKKLASYKANSKSTESAGLFNDILNDEYATESLNNFFGFESDDADETSDTETTAKETEETTDKSDDAEEETTDVNVEAEAKDEDTPAKEEEKESSSAEADDEEKAIENFFANWGL